MLADATQLSFEPSKVTLVDESVEHYVTTLELHLGPLIAARAALEAAGRWPEMQASLRGLYAASNRATDGTMRVDADYLLTTART